MQVWARRLIRDQYWKPRCLFLRAELQEFHRYLKTLWCLTFTQGAKAARCFIMNLYRNGNSHMMAAEYTAQGRDWCPFSWPNGRIWGKGRAPPSTVVYSKLSRLAGLNQEQHQGESCSHEIKSPHCLMQGPIDERNGVFANKKQHLQRPWNASGCKGVD